MSEQLTEDTVARQKTPSSPISLWIAIALWLTVITEIGFRLFLNVKTGISALQCRDVNQYKQLKY